MTYSITSLILYARVYGCVHAPNSSSKGKEFTFNTFAPRPMSSTVPAPSAHREREWAGGGLVGVELQAKDFTATARLSLTRSSQYAISCLVEEFKGFLCFAGLGRNLANSSNNWLCLSRIDPGYFLHWPGDLCRTPLDEKEVIQELLSRSRVLCESVQREG